MKRWILFIVLGFSSSPIWLGRSADCALPAPQVSGKQVDAGGSHELQARGLRGFVCDAEGKPFPQATVFVNMRKKLTDDDGTFFISHKELERQGSSLIVLVQGEREGKQFRCAKFVDYVTGKENITVALRHSASINGRVVTTDGSPIAGAKVSALMNVRGYTCHGTLPAGKPAKTDRNGRFEIVDVYPHDSYRLRVTCPGRERKVTDWIPVGTRELCKELDIHLRDAPGFVEGRVVNEKGEALEKVRVILGHPCIPDAISITDVDGKFRIEDLVPGEEVTVVVGRESQKVKVGTEQLVIVTRNRRE